MWIVIQMVKGMDNAQSIADELDAEGVLVKLRPVYKNIPEESDNYYEVKVLESEAAEARSILLEKGL